MKRTFVYSDAKSDKFWSIETSGDTFSVTFGKQGTAGQTQTKTFADEAACLKETEKLIREKTRKGYVEQTAAGAPAVSAQPPKPRAATKEKTMSETEIRQEKLRRLINKALIGYSSWDFQWYYRVVNAYGGTRKDPWPYRGLLDEDMPVLFGCIRDMPEKKVRYQTLLHNLYFMLSALSRPLAFDRVKALVDGIRAGDPMPSPQVAPLLNIHERYENSEIDHQERMVISHTVGVKHERYLKGFEHVKALLTEFHDRIDEYVEKKGLDEVFYEIIDVERYPVRENTMMEAAFAFPELHPMLEAILQKIMAANKTWPLFDEYGSSNDQRWRYYIGYGLVALFAAHDPQKYDSILLEYIADIEREFPYTLRGNGELYMNARNGQLLQRIARMWKAVPPLPLTYAAYPDLKVLSACERVRGRQ